MSLDDPAALAHLDPHGMRDALARFPAQCRAAAALGFEPAPAFDRPRLVIVAGMGGSAATGDLLAGCTTDRFDVPVLIHRGYGLPAVAGERDLVIAVSYSGETEEALSAAETALARGCALAVVAAGGPLAALARARGVPHVGLPVGLLPRLALGYLFVPLLGLLASVDLAVAKPAEIEEAFGVLEQRAAELDPSRPTGENEAKSLALAFGTRVPVIYGGPLSAAVASRWKTDLEENAKVFAAAGAVPEMNHNEIEVWTRPEARGLHLVLLRDRDEAVVVARRFALLRELAAPTAGGVSEAWTRGRRSLARLLGLAYLGQWVSFYLAMRRGVDPWLTPALDGLKRRLRA